MLIRVVMEGFITVIILHKLYAILARLLMLLATWIAVFILQRLFQPLLSQTFV